MRIHRTLGCRLWSVGGGVGLAVFSVCLLVSMRSPREYAATALLKLDFICKNVAPLSSDQYATNGPGCGPLITEARFLRSELLLRKAQERLKPGAYTPEAGAAMQDGLQTRLVPQGIQIRAIGRDAGETAALVNAVAEVYRDERNRLAPAPPGCQALSIAILRSAESSGSPVYIGPLFRSVLGAVFVGFAAARLFSRKSPAFGSPFLSTFLFWLSLLFGLAVLISPLELAVVLTGATLLAFEVAAGDACVALVASLEPSVPAKLLRYAFRSACILFIGAGIVLELLTPAGFWSSARVRVSVETPAINGELPISYDPRFVETECALICSRFISSQGVDRLQLKRALNRIWQYDLTQDQAAEIVARCTKAKMVPDTSLIDISYWGRRHDALEAAANNIAEVYRDYWDRKPGTNQARRVTVKILDSTMPSRRERQMIWSQYCHAVTKQLLFALFGIAGVLCVAAMARNPVQLYLIPLFAIVYLGVLGASAILTSLMPRVHTATCLVRIWPPGTASNAPAGERQSDNPVALLQRECKVATSELVLAKAVQALSANPGFIKEERENWETMSSSERQRLLKQRLRATPVADTFLVRLAAAAENPGVAAMVANAIGAAYCEVRNAGPDKLEVEILDRAISPMWPKSSSGPVADGLLAALGYIAVFLAGAGIGYIGYLVEKVRRAMGAAFVQAARKPGGI